jgi:hypothetical protein
LLKTHSHLKIGLTGLVALLALALFPAGAAAACNGGGVTSATIDMCTPTPKARLLSNGMLIPPKSAPKRVKQVIAAANKIRNKPYVWGGGHGRWIDRGYDCSGAVSFALKGGNFIDSPTPSGPLASWGTRGKGRWISVYANAGHTYAVIAGYRWDTSGNSGGKTGPSWYRDQRSSASGRYTVRHPAGF